MEATLKIGDETWKFDPGSPIDISIPLLFNGPQPNAYGVEPATSESCRYGDLVGDTREGGSCNFERYTFIPHCNGTHTESVGHITRERISVRDCLEDAIVPALMISVDPTVPSGNESYSIPITPTDRLITRNSIANAIEPFGIPRSRLSDFCLVVRTMPNDDSKLTRRYGDNDIPPYFSSDAMILIADCGFKHLVVDLPSIDRLFDEGRLANHRLFWNVAPGSFETGDDTHRNKTITELVYIPSTVPDGLYVINLQIAPFASDASPSRPVLFQLVQD